MRPSRIRVDECDMEWRWEHPELYLQSYRMLSIRHVDYVRGFTSLTPRQTFSVHSENDF